MTFAWNAGAPCLLAVTVAKDKGFFAKHGLDVDLVNYAGSTDQLLETLATGEADAAVGMALRWLKPMEQGFDVKIVASLHGGCMRLLAPTDSGVNTVADLKGKIIGVSDMNSPAKNFFAIVIRKAGQHSIVELGWVKTNLINVKAPLSRKLKRWFADVSALQRETKIYPCIQ